MMYKSELVLISEYRAAGDKQQQGQGQWAWARLASSPVPLGHPLTTAMGRSLTVFLLMPAEWHVSTTSLTSL